jgi:hypothetical protein
VFADDVSRFYMCLGSCSLFSDVVSLKLSHIFYLSLSRFCLVNPIGSRDRIDHDHDEVYSGSLSDLLVTAEVGISLSHSGR